LGNSLSRVKAFELSSLRKETKILLVVPAIVTYALLLISTNAEDVLALQYKNYTSQKYQIQFEYPTTWALEEKTNRFDEGSDIRLTSGGGSGLDFIGVTYADDLIRGFGTTNLPSAVNDFLDAMTNDYTKDYRVIESPSFNTIDGRNAGTFLFTGKDKFESNPVSLAAQMWITFLGDHGYSFSFMSPTDNFDSAENAEIRDHFIKSIKFLGANNQTSANTTNRFD
jgi:hypothetical protein